MDAQRLYVLLEDFRSGRLTADDVVAEVSVPSFEDIGFAKVDHHRAIRKGFPEVVFGLGKTPEQVGRLAAALLERSDRLLVTKTTLEAYRAVCEAVPDAVFDEMSRTITVDRSVGGEPRPGVVVACAGTSDLPVAAEAAVTAEIMGCRVERVNDVGVAGIHRLIAEMPTIAGAEVVVVVAGMEGALASVVGGLVRAPVIAVPTSVGYGSSFDGLAALLAMLNSCAPGVSVVNIDNGFGAGYMAAMIVMGRDSRG
ncbi:MAG: nickel pincer cofactor biosynthesis protein LarB [Chloroflexi bacterium]|nr:nickel pincer cofactor biosynthesis protein LarB [Chloroflexota bacterium]